MLLKRLLIKRFGNVLKEDIKLKKGLNVIDSINKREVAFAYCLAVGGGKFGDQAQRLLENDSEIIAEFINGDERVNVDVKKDSFTITSSEQDPDRYRTAFSENKKRDTACYSFGFDGTPKNAFPNSKEYISYFARYKDDEYCLNDDYIKAYGVKTFKTILSLYPNSINNEPIGENTFLLLQESILNF